MFNLKEIELWENGLDQRNLLRNSTTKGVVDPKFKKLKDFQKHRKTKFVYGNESKFIRNLTQRQFRRKMARMIYKEEYYSPVPHDYKTYGWLTW